MLRCGRSELISKQVWTGPLPVTSLLWTTEIDTDSFRTPLLVQGSTSSNTDTQNTLLVGLESTPTDNDTLLSLLVF